MAFNAEHYINVIVEQVAGNFSDLDYAIKHCPDLENVIKAYRDLQNKEDFFIFKKASELELRDAETKVNLYEQSINQMTSASVDCAYQTVEPLSVGLFGEWGSGKTHLLKQIESRINQLQSNPLKDEKDIFPQTTIPIFFNAWRFEKEEHLIIPLFQTMLAQLEAYEHFSFKEKTKKFSKSTLRKFKVLSLSLLKGLQTPKDLAGAIEKVANHDPSVIVDVVDTKKVVQNYKKGMEEVDKELDFNLQLKKLLTDERLEAIYYHIPQWIEKITIFENINFVFLIDDLDRCLPENTLKMLESIKLFLDVPSCAFVLAIDDDVVERGVAYHYRDYLKQVVRVDGKEEHRELPITGHEYLEKMIQLPFRIPVIDSFSVRQFLVDNYTDLFQSIDEAASLSHEEKISDRLLDFFAKAIPPKPRKIKRTVMLFSTKLKIYKELALPIDYLLIAKITLLELFAPKLLRFIQNNGYRRMFDRLVDFRTMKAGEREGSLANRSVIDQWISAYQDEKSKERYRKMMEIVQESYTTRLVFELDHIFDAAVDKDILKQNIELKAITIVKKEDRVEISVLSATFMEKLFLENDETSWRDAFEDEELFAEGKALLGEKQIEAITQEAKGKKGFCDNPKWLLVIAEYITQEQFIGMLKAIYPYVMEPYTVTFEEYDRYCEATGAKKLDDKGWGRGRRPVINVSWQDATNYAAWLSEQKKVTYRLPTEDEWYLACNVGQKTTWHFGDNKEELKEYAWYDQNANGQTHPVGEKKPNALGLYDMHGNVWEWCEDWYDEEKKEKVVRGGSWLSSASWTRSANRYWDSPDYRNFSWGFRLLRTLP